MLHTRLFSKYFLGWFFSGQQLVRPTECRFLLPNYSKNTSLAFFILNYLVALEFCFSSYSMFPKLITTDRFLNDWQITFLFWRLLSALSSIFNTLHQLNAFFVSKHHNNASFLSFVFLALTSLGASIAPFILLALIKSNLTTTNLFSIFLSIF